MKVSEIKDEEISSLTNAQKEEIVYLKDDFGHTADVGIVLGSGEEVLLGRAQAALKAYSEGQDKIYSSDGQA